MRKKVDAKNALENYIYSVKNTLRDEKWKAKFTEDDKKKLKTNFKVPNNGSKVTQKQVLNNMLNIKSKLKMSLILST